uniref:Uncharacterized protein n=1 Tax=Oryza brachyantha TaxID=4533 RepID=J3N9R8_ORYBR
MEESQRMNFLAQEHRSMSIKNDFFFNFHFLSSWKIYDVVAFGIQWDFPTHGKQQQGQW